VLDFKAETTTIPIVGPMADPVAFGILPSLARPSGNITGVSSNFDISIWSKRVEFLRAAAPRASALAKQGYLAAAKGGKPGKPFSASAVKRMVEG